VALVEDLKRAEGVRAFEATQETESQRWASRFGPLFQGVATDWNALRKAITSVRRLRDLFPEGKRPKQLADALLANRPPPLRDLRHALEQYHHALHAFEARFDPPGPLLDTQRLAEQPPDAVKQRLAVHRQRIGALPEWIQW